LLRKRRNGEKQPTRVRVTSPSRRPSKTEAAGDESAAYRRLEAEEVKPRKVRDWTARWEQLQPLASVNGNLAERVIRFCGQKGIRAEALCALDARIQVDRHGGVSLAFAGRGPTGAVTAIKYRPLDGSSRETKAEAPSVWLLPIIVGRHDSLEWFVVEGETDTARVLDLVPGTVAVLCLPAGALTFKPEWAHLIPRGATVFLLHDADEKGDEGAAKAARIIGGKTVRVRPPIERGDWCDWPGTQEEFAQLVAAARSEDRSSLHVVPLDEFAAVDEPSAEPLLGDEHDTVLSAGGALVFYGDGGAGKTTLEIDLVFHLAAGLKWLELPVPRPVKVLVIENEGPRGKFRMKLREKLANWDGPPVENRIHVLEEPWALFTFAADTHRAALRELIEEHEIDVVAAGPVQRLGIEGGGTPEEVGAFIRNIELVRSTLERPVAVLLAHHENKAGDVAGAWEGVPDTLAHVQAQGNGCTRLYWRKVRWGSELHGKTWKLLWREGESFEIDETPELTDDDVAESVLAAIREHAGGSWRVIETHCRGRGERARAARDELLESGAIVNYGKGGKFELYLADDPACPGRDTPGTHHFGTGVRRIRRGPCPVSHI
jgi:hypothetical protein